MTELKELEDAIEELRSVTAGPGMDTRWTALDFTLLGEEPLPFDYVIAAILNAVVEGRLVVRMPHQPEEQQ